MMDGGCSQVQAFHGVAGHSLASHTEKQVGYLAGPEMKFGATLSLFIYFFFVVKLQFHKFGFTWIFDIFREENFVSISIQEFVKL